MDRTALALLGLSSMPLLERLHPADLRALAGTCRELRAAVETHTRGQTRAITAYEGITDVGALAAWLRRNRVAARLTLVQCHPNFGPRGALRPLLGADVRALQIFAPARRQRSGTRVWADVPARLTALESLTLCGTFRGAAHGELVRGPRSLTELTIDDVVDADAALLAGLRALSTNCTGALVAALPGLAGLTRLSLTYWSPGEALEFVRGATRLTGLRALSLTCEDDVDLPGGADAVSAAAGLSALTALTALELQWGRAVPALAALTGLRDLKLDARGSELEDVDADLAVGMEVDFDAGLEAGLAAALAEAGLGAALATDLAADMAAGLSRRLFTAEMAGAMPHLTRLCVLADVDMPGVEPGALGGLRELRDLTLNVPAPELTALTGLTRLHLQAAQGPLPPLRGLHNLRQVLLPPDTPPPHDVDVPSVWCVATTGACLLATPRLQSLRTLEVALVAADLDDAAALDAAFAAAVRRLPGLRTVHVALQREGGSHFVSAAMGETLACLVRRVDAVKVKCACFRSEGLNALVAATRLPGAASLEILTSYATTEHQLDRFVELRTLRALGLVDLARAMRRAAATLRRLVAKGVCVMSYDRI